MKNAPKIGYAVSRGVFNGWTKEQEKEFIEYTTPFEAIAARESSFAEHIHELTGKDVPVVLDPVFLKDKNSGTILRSRPEIRNANMSCSTL